MSSNKSLNIRDGGICRLPGLMQFAVQGNAGCFFIDSDKDKVTLPYKAQHLLKRWGITQVSSVGIDYEQDEFPQIGNSRYGIMYAHNGHLHFPTPENNKRFSPKLFLLSQANLFQIGGSLDDVLFSAFAQAKKQPEEILETRPIGAISLNEFTKSEIVDILASPANLFSDGQSGYLHFPSGYLVPIQSDAIAPYLFEVPTKVCQVFVALLLIWLYMTNLLEIYYPIKMQILKQKSPMQSAIVHLVRTNI
jgi:hypothetical protein